MHAGVRLPVYLTCHDMEWLSNRLALLSAQVYNQQMPLVQVVVGLLQVADLSI